MMWKVQYEDDKIYGLFSSEKGAIEAKKRLEAFYKNVIVKKIEPIKENEESEDKG